MLHFYENRHFKNKAGVDLNWLVLLFTCLLRVVAENVVTDGQTDQPSLR